MKLKYKDFVKELEFWSGVGKLKSSGTVFKSMDDAVDFGYLLLDIKREHGVIADAWNAKLASYQEKDEATKKLRVKDEHVEEVEKLDKEFFETELDLDRKPLKVSLIKEHYAKLGLTPGELMAIRPILDKPLQS